MVLPEIGIEMEPDQTIFPAPLLHAVEVSEDFELRGEDGLPQVRFPNSKASATLDEKDTAVRRDAQFHRILTFGFENNFPPF